MKCDVSVILQVDSFNETLNLKVRSNQLPGFCVHLKFTTYALKFEQGYCELLESTDNKNCLEWVCLAQNALMFEWAYQIHQTLERANKTLPNFTHKVLWCSDDKYEEQKKLIEQLCTILEGALNIDIMRAHVSRYRQITESSSQFNEHCNQQFMQHYDRIYEISLETLLFGVGTMPSNATKQNDQVNECVSLNAQIRPELDDHKQWEQMYTSLLSWCDYDGRFSTQFKEELTSMSSNWAHQYSSEEASRNLSVYVQKRIVENCFDTEHNEFMTVNMQLIHYSVITQFLQQYTSCFIKKHKQDQPKYTNRKKRKLPTLTDDTNSSVFNDTCYSIKSIKNVSISTCLAKFKTYNSGCETPYLHTSNSGRDSLSTVIEDTTHKNTTQLPNPVLTYVSASYTTGVYCEALLERIVEQFYIGVSNENIIIDL